MKNFSRVVRNQAQLLSLAVPNLTPGAVRKYLHGKIDIPIVVSAQLLEFCLLDLVNDREASDSRTKEVCKSLWGIRFWPMLNGQLGATAGSLLLLLPRDELEMQLFERSRPDVTIHLDKLTPKVRKVVQEKIISASVVARFRTFEDLTVDWLNLYNTKHTTNNTLDSTPRDTALDGILQNVWSWIGDRLLDENPQKISALAGLWLIPLRGGIIRRLMPATNSTPALIVEQKEILHEILLNKVSEPKLSEMRVVDSAVFNKNALTVLKGRVH